jgi:hypothetical protein
MTPTAEIAALTARTQHAIDAVRSDFLAYAKDSAALGTKKSTLAPKFMRAFEAWEEETEGTFVSFVRLYDVKVPEDRDSYKSHPTYMAADYLRRLVAQAARPKTKRRSASPLEALARTLALIVPALGDDPTPLWDAFKSRLKWKDTQIHRLQSLVEHAEPLLNVNSKTSLPRLIKKAA